MDEPLLDLLAVRLREVVNASDAYRRMAAEVLGVGNSEAVAMGFLERFGPLRPSALVVLTGLSSPSMTALLDRLEQAGLVARRPNPADRRSVLVELTDSGTAALLPMVDAYYADVKQSVRELLPERVAEFTAALDCIATAVRARAADRAGMAALLAPVSAASDGSTIENPDRCNS